MAATSDRHDVGQGRLGRRSGFRAACSEVKEKAGNRSVIAAGGVRNEADIRALSSLGIAAALVATSLHDGTLTPEQLASLGA